uniref:Uncharacterized protein n=1 Tax=Magallana gigas TaxID=29159 RepID=A0A8W8MYU4_MAGGI
MMKIYIDAWGAPISLCLSLYACVDAFKEPDSFVFLASIGGVAVKTTGGVVAPVSVYSMMQMTLRFFDCTRSTQRKPYLRDECAAL